MSMTTLYLFIRSIPFNCNISISLFRMHVICYTNEARSKQWAERKRRFSFFKKSFSLGLLRDNNKHVTIKFTTIYYTDLKRQKVACFKICVPFMVSCPLNTVLQCWAHEQRSQLRLQQHVHPLLFFSTHTRRYLLRQVSQFLQLCLHSHGQPRVRNHRSVLFPKLGSSLYTIPAHFRCYLHFLWLIFFIAEPFA
jgi:hypothetical protein